MSSQENFLDKTTLTALVLLGLSWFAWQAYIKQKYPPIKKTANEPVQKIVLKDTTPSLNKSVLSKKPENLLGYKGDKFNFQLSSQGMGFKSLELSKYKDEAKKNIKFSSLSEPLFSWVTDKGTPVHFNLKRKGLVFVGKHKSPYLHAEQQIKINEKESSFDVVTTVFKNKDQNLKLVFQESKKPVKEDSSFFLSSLFIQQAPLNLFISDEKGEEIFFSGETLDKNSFQHIKLLALGSKYFGQAFINFSEWRPKAYVELQESKIKVFIEYPKDLLKTPYSLKYKVFMGPKSLDSLTTLDSSLASWIDFGFFDWFARPLLRLLKFFFSLSGNWGFAIILLTFFVRFCLLPLNMSSYKSMKVMQKLQPQLQSLREKYKKEPSVLNKKVMDLMKDNKANPLGGCLPIFFQFPVFFALYRVLLESIEIYQAPFIFWISDLSSRDPYYIYPVLGGLTLFVQQKITPTNMPPAQARILSFMPIIFSFFMLGLPSGLTLYIFVSSLFGLIQQFIFVRLKDND